MNNNNQRFIIELSKPTACNFCFKEIRVHANLRIKYDLAFRNFPGYKLLCNNCAYKSAIEVKNDKRIFLYWLMTKSEWCKQLKPGIKAIILDFYLCRYQLKILHVKNKARQVLLKYLKY